MANLSHRVRLVVYSSGSGVVGKIGQFLGLTFLAFFFSNEEYGRLAVLQIVIMGVSTIVGSGLALAANKSAAAVLVGDPELPLRHIIAFVLVAYAPKLVLAALINCVFVPILFSVLSGEAPAISIQVLALASSCIVLIDVLAATMAGAGKYKNSSLVDGVRGLGSGIFALALGVPFGYVGAGFGLLVADLALALWLAGLLVRGRKDRRKYSILVPKLNAVVGSGILSSSFTQISNWLVVFGIQSGFGLSGVGLYSVANRFATLALIVPGYLSKNMLGEIGKHFEARETKARKSAISFYILTTLGFALLACLGAVAAVMLGFDGLVQKYPGLMTVLIILLVGTCFRALATSLGVVCVAQSQLKAWIWSDAAALVITGLGVLTVTVLEGPLPLLLLTVVVGNAASMLVRFGAVHRYQDQREASR